MHARVLSVLLAGTVVLTGCKSTVEQTKTTVESGGVQTRAITLTEGDTISVAVDVSGAGTVTVTRGERTYTSDSKDLLQPGRDAKNALGKPGVTVWIRVDKSKRIAAIGWSQKLQ